MFEKALIDRAIADFEKLLKTKGDAVDGGSGKKRRGRKGIEPEERRLVSERMKRYWANRQRRSA
ncbi:MAG: hypothetical protein ACLQOO_17335 [Terriglobia bacterium]